MLRFRFLALLLASVSLTGCKDGPRVTVCVLDPVNASLECSDPDGNGVTLPIADAENFVCFSPEDLEKLVRACTRGRAYE